MLRNPRLSTSTQRKGAWHAGSVSQASPRAPALQTGGVGVAMPGVQPPWTQSLSREHSPQVPPIMGCT